MKLNTTDKQAPVHGYIIPLILLHLVAHLNLMADVKYSLCCLTFCAFVSCFMCIFCLHLMH